MIPFIQCFNRSKNKSNQKIYVAYTFWSSEKSKRGEKTEGKAQRNKELQGQFDRYKLLPKNFRLSEFHWPDWSLISIRKWWSLSFQTKLYLTKRKSANPTVCWVRDCTVLACLLALLLTASIPAGRAARVRDEEGWSRKDEYAERKSVETRPQIGPDSGAK